MKTTVSLKALWYCCRTMQHTTPFNPRNPLANHKALMVLA